MISRGLVISNRKRDAFSKLRSVFAFDLPKGVIIIQTARPLLVITLLAASCLMGCSDKVATPPVPSPAVSTPAAGTVPATPTVSAPEPGRAYHAGYSIVPPEGWTYKPGKHASFIGLNENLVVVVESDPSPTALAHLEKSLPAMRKGRIDFQELGRSELQIDGKPALALICAYGAEGQRVKVVLYAVSQGDQHVALIFTTPEEMFDPLQEKFKKCALSFRFRRPTDPTPTAPPVNTTPSKAALDNFGPYITWHVPDGKNVSMRVVNDLKFSPDGSLIASATDAEDVIVWSTTTTGKPIHAFTGHTKNVNAVEYSPDGKLLISASDDSTILGWDLSTGQLKYKLGREDEPVSDLALSPDGRQLASCSKIAGKVAVHFR